MGREAPLMPAQHFAYQRVPRDRAWSFAFVLFWVASVVAGVYAITHRCASLEPALITCCRLASLPSHNCTLILVSPASKKSMQCLQ